MSTQIKPISLGTRVTIKEGSIPQLLQQIEREGVILPRSDVRPRVGIIEILATANRPVGIPLEAYQRSAGKIPGRIKHAEDREEAYAVRRQFAEFLEVMPPDELTDRPAR